MAKAVTKKTYIGYDLGDGETITDLVTLATGKSTSKTVFDNMTMPDTVIPGKAMPTIFAFDNSGNVLFLQTILADPESVKNIVINFKRCQSDLLSFNSNRNVPELITKLEKASDWPTYAEWPDGHSKEMLKFKDSVIAFTNAIFNDRNYINRIKTVANDSDEIVFCVGHPTNWSLLDIAIYELILKCTVLGSGKYADKKSGIIMEAESRAAFLYAKDVEAFGKLPKGSSVLLIDIGSSTIDITAMTAAANNNEYYSGSNYLGARSIDYMIRDWYLEKLQKNPADWNLYKSAVKANPTFPNALTLACRRAKEDLYSSPNGIAVIHFGLFPGVRLSADELDRIIDNTPVANILRETINLPEQECARMGNKSWKKLFREFLTEKKNEMTNRNRPVKVGYIILTGSASKMPFVPEIVLEVFNEVSSDCLGYDMDPSRTISKGLALVGPSNEKSKAFSEDLNNLIDKKLEKIIKDNIPSLANDMGQVVQDILTPIMKKHVYDWKEGKIDTLDNMNKRIKADCSENALGKLLSENKKYKDTIKKWLTNKVGKDIAVELKGLCNKYGVAGISVEDLNIMTVPQIPGGGGISINPLEFMDIISAIVSIIAGVVAYASIATIMAVVVVVLSYISATLASALFTALVAMGPVGWTILAGVVGIAVAALVAAGFDSFKNTFNKKVMSWNLPKVARQVLTDKSIEKAFTDADIKKQVTDSFNKPELKNDIVKKVSENLKKQIKVRAEDIKYAIESK